MFNDPTKSVPERTRFRHVDDEGNVVESARSMGTSFARYPRVYVSTVANVNMIRTDGVKIGFGPHKFYLAKLQADQDYLNAEIAMGHPSVRHATDEEEHQYKMLTNPVGTIRQEVLDDPKVREEIEQNFLESLRAKGLLKDGAEQVLSPNPHDTTQNALTPQEKLAALKGEVLKPGSTADLGGGAKNSGS